MPGFVTDSSSLPYPKQQLYPLPLSADPTRYVSPSDWNTFGAALRDLRLGIVAGAGVFGFSSTGSRPGFQDQSTSFLWQHSDGELMVTVGGSDYRIGIGGGSPSGSKGAAMGTADSKLTVVGVDTGFELWVTGSAGATSGTIATLTFSRPFSRRPILSIQPMTGPSYSLAAFYDMTLSNSGSVTIGSINGLVSGSGYAFSVGVDG
jgi:hypothetical protein